MNNTYYIYHIPSFKHKNGKIGKIGCSEEPVDRVAIQGYSDYEILEQHTCIYMASDRELQLQREYDYPVDKIPYWKSRSKWGSNAASMVSNEQRIMGGKSLRQFDNDVIEYIRNQYARKIDYMGKKITQRRLANLFDVHYTTINKIVTNKRYSEI